MSGKFQNLSRVGPGLGLLGASTLGGLLGRITEDGVQVLNSKNIKALLLKIKRPQALE